VTDHRIGLTLYNLPQVMEGGIDELIAGLHQADYEEKLAALTGQTYAPARFTGED
jgi:peptide chain release factor 1